MTKHRPRSQERIAGLVQMNAKSMDQFRSVTVRHKGYSWFNLRSRSSGFQSLDNGIWLEIGWIL
jgi:hypothetical protein